MSVPKKNIEDFFNPRVVDKEKYISEDINYLKDIINKKAGVIDMMSPGPLKDELRGTYDPTQESYEEFLQRQSIPQMDRPLTGQAPSDAILETQRIDLNEGGVLGPGGMFRGEDLGTREGFAELKPAQLTELKQKHPDWNDKYKFGFPKSDSRYGKIRSIARKEQKAEYNKRPEVSEARREREKTKYQTDLEYREKILEKNRRNAAKLDATLKRQAKQKEYYYKKGGREKALQRLKGVSIEKNYGSYMQNTDNALFKDMVRAAEQDSDLKIIRGGPENQVVAIKEGNKTYHPVGAKREPIPGAPKNSISIVKHPAFKQRAEINKAINTFANTKVPGIENLTYKKALDAIQSQIAGTPLQNKNPAEFEHVKGVATDYKKGQLALRTSNRDKELIVDRLKKGIITKPVAVQELKNLGVRAYVDGKYIGAPKINVNKQIGDYKKYVDRMIKNDPNYFSELGQGKASTRKINFLKDVEPVAGRLQKSLVGSSKLYSFPGMLAEPSAYQEAIKGGKLLGTKLLQGLVTPAGAALITDVDLKDPMNRVGLGAEAAFAPELVKSTIGLTKGMKNRVLQKGIQRLLNLGLSTPMALRLARALQPVGIASLIGEGVYQFGKAQKEYLEGLDPEKRIAVEEEYRDVAAADGGRIGLANGPKDPSKRKFMKIGVGILGALPFGATKLLQKPAVQEAATKAIPAAEAGWSWIKDNFWEVVGTVKNKAKTFAKLKDGEVRIHKDMKVIENPETIRVRYKTDNDNMAETVYTKPYKEVNPETGEIIDIPGDFQEYQDVYRLGDKEVYKDFEEEIIDSVENVKKIIKED
jgi:hypothetical protein